MKAQKGCIHIACGFCMFGTKSYAQSALINNNYYHCPLLYAFHVHFCVKLYAHMALINKIGMLIPFRSSVENLLVGQSNKYFKKIIIIKFLHEIQLLYLNLTTSLHKY